MQLQSPVHCSVQRAVEGNYSSQSSDTARIGSFSPHKMDSGGPPSGNKQSFSNGNRIRSLTTVIYKVPCARISNNLSI